MLSERRVAVALPFDARPVIGSQQSDLDLELLRSTYVTAVMDPEVLEKNGRPLAQQLLNATPRSRRR